MLTASGEDLDGDLAEAAPLKGLLGANFSGIQVRI